jgi:hypothetical protein
LHFCFGGGELFLEKGKGVFSFGLLPSKYSGSAWGFNTDSADFPLAGGVWGGMRAEIQIQFLFFDAATLLEDSSILDTR